MKTKFFLFAAMIAGAMLATSCEKDGDDNGGGGGNGGGTAGAVEHLDITDAAYLYTTSSSGTTRASSGNPARLFKVLADGTSEQVEITDGEGNPVVADEIHIIKITDDIIRFGYSVGTNYNYYDGPYELHEYFARKSDGAVFEVPKQLYKNVGAPEKAMYIQTDKKQNIYCAGYREYQASWGEDFMPKGIYKITTSGSGITADPIVSDELGEENYFFSEDTEAAFAVDMLGNVIYISSYGNYHCIKSNGETFQIDNLSGWSKMYAMPDNTNGGFLCVMSDGELCTLAMNATADGFDKRQLTHQGAIDVPDPDDYVPISVRSTRSMQDCTYSSFYGSVYKMSDKLVLSGTMDGTVEVEGLPTRSAYNFSTAINIVIKSASDVTFYENEAISHDATVLSDGIYWSEGSFSIGNGPQAIDPYFPEENNGNSAQKFDPETGVVSQVYQYTPEAGWEYSSFSFAEGVIMYYATDNANEKRYRFEVRNGNATKTDITDEGDSVPTVINFVRVN